MKITFEQEDLEILLKNEACKLKVFRGYYLVFNPVINDTGNLKGIEIERRGRRERTKK